MSCGNEEVCIGVPVNLYTLLKKRKKRNKLKTQIHAIITVTLPQYQPVQFGRNNE